MTSFLLNGHGKCGANCFTARIFEKLSNKLLLLQEKLENRNKHLFTLDATIACLTNDKKALQSKSEELKNEEAKILREIGHIKYVYKSQMSKIHQIELVSKTKDKKFKELVPKYNKVANRKLLCEKENDDFKNTIANNETKYKTLQTQFTTCKNIILPKIEILEKKINKLKVSQNNVIEELEKRKLINKVLTKDSQRLTETLDVCEKTRKVFVYTGGGDTENDLKKCKEENALMQKRLYSGEFVKGKNKETKNASDTPNIQCYGAKKKQAAENSIYKLKENVKTLKGKLFIKETYKKNQLNRFYEMHAMHGECVAKSEKKNNEIEEFWAARMQCEVNVMTNEREAAKFESLYLAQDRHLKLINRQHHLVNRKNLQLHQRVHITKKNANYLRFDNTRQLIEKANLLKKTAVIRKQMDRHLDELAITRKTQTQQHNHVKQFKDDQKKLQMQCIKFEKTLIAEKQKNNELAEEINQARAEIIMYQTIGSQDLVDAKYLIDQQLREIKKLQFECRCFKNLVNQTEVFKRWASFEIERDVNTLYMLYKCRDFREEYMKRYKLPKFARPPLGLRRRRRAALIGNLVKCKAETRRLTMALERSTSAAAETRGTEPDGRAESSSARSGHRSDSAMAVAESLADEQLPQWTPRGSSSAELKAPHSFAADEQLPQWTPRRSSDAAEENPTGIIPAKPSCSSTAAETSCAGPSKIRSKVKKT